MKTPREILFEHYRQAEPRLEAIQRDVLATVAGATASNRLKTSRSPKAGNWLRHALRRLPVGARALLRQIWLELIWPSRHAWAGMAALWLGVVMANFQMRATSSPVPQSAPGRDLVKAVEAQRRLLAELLPPGQPPVVQAPRPTPRPRSEGSAPFKAC